MNKETRIFSKFKLFVLLAFYFFCHTANALIPEPPNIIYGIVTVDGETVSRTKTQVKVQLSVNSNVIKTYTLGDSISAGDHFILTANIDALEPRSPNSVRVGDNAEIILLVDNEVALQSSLVIQNRGTIRRLDQNLAPTVDTNGDGIEDGYAIAGIYALVSSDGSSITSRTLDPTNDDPANTGTNGDENTVTTTNNKPTLTIPEDLIIVASGYVSNVDFGNALGFDEADGELTVSPDSSGPFKSGNHVITWSATNSSEQTTTATQNLIIIPLVELSPNRFVEEGSSIDVEFTLSGEAAAYPVIIPYSISGSADSNDHNAVNGELAIAEGRVGSISLQILEDSIQEPDETLVITLGDPVNARKGGKQVQTIILSEQNVVPQIALSIKQNGLNTRKITKDGGQVTVSASISDINKADTHDIDWSKSDNVLIPPTDLISTSFSIDPTQLIEGVYKLSLTVSDSGSPSKEAHTELLIDVIEIAPTLAASNDSDNDGIDDLSEGYTDDDQDGIPNYLDAMEETNLLPIKSDAIGSWLVATENGLHISMGNTAFKLNKSTPLISLNEAGYVASAADLESNLEVEKAAYVDFIIQNIPMHGSTVKTVIPLSEPIAQNETFKLYSNENGLVKFIRNENNNIMSATGNAGVCPSPGNENYTADLTEGDYCLQISVKDGGINDADQREDGIIQILGGISPINVNVKSKAGSSDNSDDDGACFIATAAYGSYLSSEVKILRQFRDEYLLTNPLGQQFVETYYALSPPIADFIASNETFKTLTRWLLTPIVYSVKYPMVLLLLVLIMIMRLAKRYRKHNKMPESSSFSM